MARYEIDCRGCGAELGETDDPQQAYDIAYAASNDEHGSDVNVTARGLINRVRFDRANTDR
jgi:hypothetical protein